MNYAFLAIGILIVAALGALICVVSFVGHQIAQVIDLTRRIEQHVQPETVLMYNGDGAGHDVPGTHLPESAVEEIMRRIRGETKDMKDFLKSINDEDDEQDEE